MEQDKNKKLKPKEVLISLVIAVFLVALVFTIVYFATKEKAESGTKLDETMPIKIVRRRIGYESFSAECQIFGAGDPLPEGVSEYTVATVFRNPAPDRHQITYEPQSGRFYFNSDVPGVKFYVGAKMTKPQQSIMVFRNDRGKAHLEFSWVERNGEITGADGMIACYVKNASSVKSDNTHVIYRSFIGGVQRGIVQKSKSPIPSDAIDIKYFTPFNKKGEGRHKITYSPKTRTFLFNSTSDGITFYANSFRSPEAQVGLVIFNRSRGAEMRIMQPDFNEDVVIGVFENLVTG